MRHRNVLVFAAHVSLFALALFLAQGLLYNFKNFEYWFRPFFLPLLPIVLFIKTLVFWRMKLFRGSWRYVGMRDLMSVVKATYLSTFLFIVVYFVLETICQQRGTSFLGRHIFDPELGKPRDLIFPQSTFLLDLGMTIAVICGARRGAWRNGR